MIGVELLKQRRRTRSWVTLGVMAIVPVILTVVIGSTRPSEPERVGEWLSVTTNSTGMTMPLIAINAMIIFLFPLAVAIFAGDTVASEATWGSLRYALARPVSRVRFLVSKGVVAASFSVAAIACACLSALITGVVAFGWHPLAVLDLQHTTPFNAALGTFSPAASIGRIVLTVGFVVSAMASTFSFSLFLSTLTNRPFSAVAGGVGLSLVSRALDNVPGLASLSPWLPATNAGASLWTGFFTQPAQIAGMTHFFIVQGAYTACFLAAAVLWFERTDILD